MLISRATVWFSVIFLSRQTVVNRIAGGVCIPARFFASDARWPWAIFHPPKKHAAIAVVFRSGDD